jgi:hypothetical protein
MDGVPKLWMVDFEGTLTDNAWRQHLITGPDKDWRSYLKGLVNDEPKEHILNLVKAVHKDTESQVIIYTTRTQTKYDLERTWMTAHGIQDCRYLYRESSKLVGAQLLRLWVEDLRPHYLIDDRPDNRNTVKDIVPNVYDPQELVNAYFDPKTRRVSYDR